MRNDDGSTPGQPKRTAVTIYLCEEAREVLRQERALANYVDLPAARDSEVVEWLLLQHGNSKDRKDWPGLSLKELQDHVELKEARAEAARAALERLSDTTVQPNRRTLSRIANPPRPNLTASELAEQLRMRNTRTNETAILALVKDLRPLLMHDMRAQELVLKVRRQIDAYIDRLIGVSGS